MIHSLRFTSTLIVIAVVYCSACKKKDAPPAVEPAVKPVDGGAPKDVPVDEGWEIVDRIPAHELKRAGGGNPDDFKLNCVAILGDSRFMHWDKVLALTYDAQGRRLAVCSADGAITIRDAKSGECLRVLQVSTSPAHIAAFGPEESELVSVDAGGTVCIWDVESGKQKRDFQTIPFAKSTDPTLLPRSISASGKVYAESSDQSGRVRLWDVATGKRLHELTLGSSGGFATALSPDGKQLAAVVADELCIWSAATGAITQRKKLGAMGNVQAYSNDGKQIVCWTGNGAAVWNPATDELRTVPMEANGITRAVSARISPDGNHLATAGRDRIQDDRNGDVRLWDIATGKELRAIARHQRSVLAIAFHPNGKEIASGDAGHRVRISDVADKEDWPRSVPGPATSVSWGLDGALLAWGTAGGNLGLWRKNNDARTSISVSSGDGDLKVLGFLRNNERLLATAGGTLYQVHLQSRIATNIHQISAYSYTPVSAFNHDPDDWTVARFRNLTDEMVLVSRNITFPLPHEKDFVWSMAYSPDGKRLYATTGKPGLVRLMAFGVDTKSADLKLKDSNIGLVCVSPNGKLLATTDNERVVALWDALTGDLKRAFPAHREYVTAIAFSPDSALLASSSEDGLLRLFDVESGAAIESIQVGPPKGRISDLAFAPSGKLLATANGNGSVYVLDLEPNWKRWRKAN